MEFFINIKNADESMIKAIKAMLETKPNIDFKITRSKTQSRLKSAIAAVERGEIISFDSYQQAMEYLNDEN